MYIFILEIILATGFMFSSILYFMGIFSTSQIGMGLSTFSFGLLLLGFSIHNKASNDIEKEYIKICKELMDEYERLANAVREIARYDRDECEYEYEGENDGYEE